MTRGRTWNVQREAAPLIQVPYMYRPDCGAAYNRPASMDEKDWCRLWFADGMPERPNRLSGVRPIDIKALRQVRDSQMFSVFGETRARATVNQTMIVRTEPGNAHLALER